jgi:hypothetical protein
MGMRRGRRFTGEFGFQLSVRRFLMRFVSGFVAHVIDGIGRTDGRYRLSNRFVNGLLGALNVVFCLADLFIPSGFQLILGFIEFPKPTAQGLAEFRQLLGPEDYKRDNENYDKLRYSERTHSKPPLAVMIASDE